MLTLPEGLVDALPMPRLMQLREAQRLWGGAPASLSDPAPASDACSAPCCASPAGSPAPKVSSLGHMQASLGTFQHAR